MVIKRPGIIIFYDLSGEIIIFLTIEENTKYEFLEDEKWRTKVSFLTDIFKLLNKLNTSMQGHNEMPFSKICKNIDFEKSGVYTLLPSNQRNFGFMLKQNFLKYTTILHIVSMRTKILSSRNNKK